MKTIITTIILTLAFSTACEAESTEADDFRSAECTIAASSLTVDYSIDGFDLTPPSGCTSDVYLDVDDLTLNSTDGVGVIFGDEIDGWTEVEPYCDPSSQSCPSECDPSSQTCPTKPKKVWVTTTPTCCDTLTGCTDC